MEKFKMSLNNGKKVHAAQIRVRNGWGSGWYLLLTWYYYYRTRKQCQDPSFSRLLSAIWWDSSYWETGVFDLPDLLSSELYTIDVSHNLSLTCSWPVVKSLTPALTHSIYRTGTARSRHTRRWCRNLTTRPPSTRRRRSTAQSTSSPSGRTWTVTTTTTTSKENHQRFNPVTTQD